MAPPRDAVVSTRERTISALFSGVYRQHAHRSAAQCERIAVDRDVERDRDRHGLADLIEDTAVHGRAG